MTNIFLPIKPFSTWSKIPVCRRMCPEGLILVAAQHHGSGVGSGPEPAVAVNIPVPLDAPVAAQDLATSQHSPLFLLICSQFLLFRGQQKTLEKLIC